MLTNDKPNTTANPNVEGDDLGQVGGRAIIEISFVVRLMGLQVWRDAVFSGRIPLRHMKPRTVNKLGHATGSSILRGIRTDFGGFSESGFAIGYEVDACGGHLDAPDFMNAGSMEADRPDSASSSICIR